jgi:tetratricopeptide (TPR) repeat protein
LFVKPITIILFASTLTAFAQPSPLNIASSQVLGTVENLGPVPAHTITVELLSATPADSYRGFLNPNGQFSFQRVEYGDYTLRLASQHGEAIYQAPLSVRMGVTQVEVRLPAVKSERGGPPVSARRLRHKVPKEASREFNRAVEDRQQGDLPHAEQHLEAAVRLDPEYAEAWVNLGAIRARNRDYSGAAKAFEAAANADPGCAMAHHNLAFAYLHLRRPADAEREARLALRLEPGNDVTRGLLDQSPRMGKVMTRMAFSLTGN